MEPAPEPTAGIADVPAHVQQPFESAVLVPPPAPDKDTAQFYYQTVTTLYLTHVATAGLFFAPQVALLTGLLTSDGRVGGVGWVVFLLVASDLLTVYFGWTAVVDSLTVELAGRELERTGGFTSLAKDPKMPSAARWVDRTLDRITPRGSGAVTLLLLAIVGGVLLTSGYTLWLWFHP